MAPGADALAAVHSVGDCGVLSDPLRAGVVADPAHDTRHRSCAQLDRRMAAARLQPCRSLRIAAAGGTLRPVARDDTAGRASPGGAWSAAFCFGTGTQCGSAGHSGASLSGSAAVAAISQSG